MTPREGLAIPTAHVLELLDAMERAQATKVVELARRLRPGLTPEDIRNPHDFPDLDDPDWHFEDGQLAGIQSVRFAFTQLARDLGAAPGEPLEAGGPPRASELDEVVDNAEEGQ